MFNNSTAVPCLSHEVTRTSQPRAILAACHRRHPDNFTVTLASRETGISPLRHSLDSYSPVVPVAVGNANSSCHSRMSYLILRGW